MFAFESYEKAHTVREAVELLEQNPDARPIAGGTDVLVRLRGGHPDYRHLVDIHDVAELKGLSVERDGTLVIGSGVTFTELTEAEAVARTVPVLAEAASTVGGPQVRNVGTLGGNLCNGAPSADGAAALLVLNAVVVLEGVGSVRRVPLHEFYQGPGKVDRRQAEILTAVRIARADYQGWCACYRKYAVRDAMDIATVGCAAAFQLEGERLSEVRLAYAVAGPTPLRCWKTEATARGARVDGALLRLLRASVLDDLKPRDSWRASKAFREHLIATLTERVSRQALQRGGVFLP